MLLQKNLHWDGEFHSVIRQEVNLALWTHNIINTIYKKFIWYINSNIKVTAFLVSKGKRLKKKDKFNVAANLCGTSILKDRILREC